MKTIIHILLLLGLSFPSFSQPFTIQTLSLFMDIDAEANNPNTLYVSTLGMGVIKTTNSGDTWFLASSGIEGKDVRTLATSPQNINDLIATIWNNCCPVGGFLGIYKSADGGMNWAASNNGLTGSNNLGPIAYDPSNANTLYVGGYGGKLYKSIDNGNNWSPLTGVSGDINAIHVQSNGTVWCGGWGGLRKSTNGGTTWQTMTGLPSGQNIAMIKSGSQDLNTIYIMLGNAQRQIYKTTDSGSSWAQTAQQISGGAILGVSNNANTLFVGNKKGCYQSTDGGNNWNVIDTSSILLANEGTISDADLFVAGGGVYAIRGIVTTMGDDFQVVPMKFSLSQNYPNPFNPSTIIEFRTNEESNVAINVYNSTGELVKNLFNENLTPGLYTVRWDGTNNYGEKLSSGTYFYRINAGESFETKKMILLK